MRHRRSSGPGDSLDLLLDTICNTFGGVLFLSLLIVLMIRPISQSNSEAASAAALTPEALDAMALEVESLRKEVDALRATLQAQKSLLEETDTTAIASREEQLQRAQDQLRQAEEDADRMIAETARAIADTRANEASLAALDGQLEQKRQQVDQARARLEQARRDAPARTSQGGGELKSTRKRNVALILSHDRAYVWHRYDASGNRIGLNTDEFLVVERTEDGIVTQPKRTAGIPIKTEDAAQALENRLARFPPRAFYLEIVLHADSFDSFQDFKQLLLQMNYEYRLILKHDDLNIVDQGGNDARVQ